MQDVGLLHVVDIGALAAQQAQVFNAFDRGADQAFALGGGFA